jgi:hypothetical protein
MRIVKFLAFLVALLYPLPACAYVGPGLGLGVLGVLLGILFSVFLAIFGIFWYPIKRLLAKFRKGPQKDDVSR